MNQPAAHLLSGSFRDRFDHLLDRIDNYASVCDAEHELVKSEYCDAGVWTFALTCHADDVELARIQLTDADTRAVMSYWVDATLSKHERTVIRRMLGQLREDADHLVTFVTPTAYPFTDPVSGRQLTLHTDATPGVEHPGCEQRALVSPELDAFYCDKCRCNGRISGDWYRQLLVVAQ